MSFLEVFWRMRQYGWTLKARLTRRVREHYFRKTATSTNRIAKQIEKIRFYALSELDPEQIPAVFRQSALQAADRLMAHRWSCLGLSEIYWGEKVRWNHEWKRDIDTPLSFAPWMEYRTSRLCGHFKYYWEMGRFQHLVTLAKAYYLSGEEKYAREAAEQIHEFHKQCPYLLGVHWIMPMETGLRLISLVWLIAFLKEYLRRDIQTCQILEILLLSHVEYTTKRYSEYSSSNNHLIGELTGVFMAALCFEDIEDLGRHKEKTWQRLCREITRQFYSDGVNKEQSTHYHISCYNCFLLAALLARANDMPVLSSYWEALERGAEFVAALAQQDFSMPSIGDSDDGKTILLSDTNYNQVQSLLATGAVLFCRDDFRAKARFFDEMSFWLLGPRGHAVFRELKNSSSAIPSRFPQGGYYLLQADGGASIRILFDCGPLGFEPLAAHGHSDALSVLLWAYDQPFLVDSGTYLYEIESPFRNYFRSTRAHNTVCVDHLNQSEIAGPFLWSSKAEAFLEEWSQDADRVRVSGWHNGYERLSDPVIHKRTVELDKKQQKITILDSIVARQSHEISIFFHFSPQCDVREIRDRYWEIENQGKRIFFMADPGCLCRIVKAGKEPLGGWVSPQYDVLEPAFTLCCSAQITGNRNFSSTIYCQEAFC